MLSYKEDTACPSPGKLSGRCRFLELLYRPSSPLSGPLAGTNACHIATLLLLTTPRTGGTEARCEVSRFFGDVLLINCC